MRAVALFYILLVSSLVWAPRRILLKTNQCVIAQNKLLRPANTDAYTSINLTPETAALIRDFTHNSLLATQITKDLDLQKIEKLISAEENTLLYLKFPGNEDTWIQIDFKQSNPRIFIEFYGSNNRQIAQLTHLLNYYFMRSFPNLWKCAPLYEKTFIASVIVLTLALCTKISLKTLKKIYALLGVDKSRKKTLNTYKKRIINPIFTTSLCIFIASALCGGREEGVKFSNYNKKAIRFPHDTRATIFFWECHQQEEAVPSCAAHALYNAMAIYSHLARLESPTLKDVFNCTFIRRETLLELIEQHRCLNKLEKFKAIPCDTYPSLIKTLKTASPEIESAHARTFLDSSFFVESKSVSCFIPKSWEHNAMFYDLSEQNQSDKKFKKLLYKNLHQGKIVVTFWASYNNFTTDGDTSPHGTCKVLVPTLKNGILTHINIVILDSSKASYYKSYQSPHEALNAFYQLDLIDFLGELFIYVPSANSSQSIHRYRQR